MKTRILVSVVALVLALGGHTVRSATIVWTNSAGGNWNAPANWSPNQVPVAADDAVITNNGTYTVTLNVSATVASLTLGGTSGTQAFVINANTLTLNGTSTIGSNGSLNLGGGTLGGAGTLVVNGPFNWTSGTVANTGGVTLNGNSALSGVGNSTMSLTGRLINGGQLSWGGSGNNLAFSNGNLTNLTAGTITFTTDASSQNGGGNNSLGNAGLLRKTGGTGTNTLTVPFVNTGTVQVQNGTLNLNVATGGLGGGTFEPFAGATLRFANTYTLTNSTITGAGTVLVSGTLALSGANTTGNNVTLNLAGGTLGGAGTLVVNGPFNWSSGNINNTGGVTLNGTSSLNGVGNASMTLTGRLINGGQLSWGGSGNNLAFSNGTLTNLAAGTISSTADASTLNSGGNNSLGNAGLLRKTGGPGTNTLAVPFVNTGTLDVQTGMVRLNATRNLTNGILNFGISSPADFGRINLSGSAGLAGTVSANLIGGYIPNSTNSFDVLSYSSLTGVFTGTNLPSADAWAVIYCPTITALKVLNARPLLTPAPDQTVNELTLLTATNTATDLDTPSQALVFGLVAAPVGMIINPGTGVITWTPAQTQSPSTNTILVSVTDNGTPPLSATNSFKVIVREVNVAPSLPLLSQKTVNVLALLTVTNTATNANIHSTITGYSLVSPPAGANISANGIITWTPTALQGPATNTITTVVTNFNPHDVINPSLTATNSFTVIVFALTLGPLANFTVDVGQAVAFTASATHNDSTRTLAFSLGTAPTSANINPVSGLFNWRPPATSAGSSNKIQVIVTDNSVPPLVVTQSFYVLVNALTPVTLAPLSKTPTQFQLQVTGPIGPDYVLQANDNLGSVAWVNLLTNTPVASPFSVTDTSVSAFPNRFYRLKLAP